MREETGKNSDVGFPGRVIEPRVQQVAHPTSFSRGLKALFWKEWREQRWKMAFGTVMLLFVEGALFATQLTSSGEIVIVIWIFGGLLFALYSAMGVFAPEQMQRTTAFLGARPIQAWKVFLVKWLVGWLNFAVPLLLCSIIIILRECFFSDRNIYVNSNDVLRGTISGLAATTMFYTLTCCLAPRKSSEALVGFVGLIVVLILILHFAFINIAFPRFPVEHLFLSQCVAFVNPVFWIFFVGPINRIYDSLLLLEQTAVFVFVFWLGMRKWRRSL